MKLSIIIPVYNEAATIGAVVRRVLDVDVGCGEKELIVVDDGSSDGTCGELDLLGDPRVRVIRQPRNMGKGAAVAEALKHFTGDAVVVQDADVEYDPADLKEVLRPLVEGRADVVYGSRFSRGRSDGETLVHYAGNRILTGISNVLTGLRLTDMETCYKMFGSEVARRLDIEEKRFGIEPEITAKVASMGVRVAEVPIGYRARSYAEGKKIGGRDALRALYVMGKYWVKLKAKR
ncbi:MAG: glycosyltransferase family 2 protein [Deltaproteobacteria bacterium]|nr:glycosyltransferase family 2 protein [Deltaproteobacteria bacterium]